MIELSKLCTKCSQTYNYKGRIDVGQNSISAEFKLTIRSTNGQENANGDIPG